MVSLVRLLGFPYEHFRGSFLQGNALLEARFRDGTFDRWHVDQGISAGWKMHPVCSLSKNVESQAV